MNASALAQAYGLPVDTVRKRLQRGQSLSLPYRVREKRDKAYRPMFVPDPLNAAFMAWPRRAPRLGVRCNLRFMVRA